MKKFYYHQDVKTEVWRRNHFVIIAETKEEADEIADEICGDEYDVADNDTSMTDLEFTKSEYLFDTERVTGQMKIYYGNDLVTKRN